MQANKTIGPIIPQELHTVPSDELAKGTSHLSPGVLDITHHVYIYLYTYIYLLLHTIIQLCNTNYVVYTIHSALHTILHYILIYYML